MKHSKMKIYKIITITLIILLLGPLIGCSPSQEELDYNIHLGESMDFTWNLWTQYNVGYLSPSQIQTCRQEFEDHLKTFRNPPLSISSTLTQAALLYKEGITQIVTGLDQLERGYDNYQVWDQGVVSLDEGIEKINRSVEIYNSYLAQQYDEPGEEWFFLGILIGTGILWILTLVVINPLTNKKLGEYFHLHPQKLTEDEESNKDIIQGVYNRIFIKMDCIVLGIAGFLLGTVVGWPFIGLSFRKIGWPGMLAFIGSSFLGFYLRRLVI